MAEGDRFLSQLPSTVTSTVDHSLGSPSLYRITPIFVNMSSIRSSACNINTSLLVIFVQ
jgi:hypothetical protein